MSSEDFAIKVESISKCYAMYSNPHDRLKQFLLPKIQCLLHLPQKNYYHEFWALKNISLTINKGETIGILGRNGSGKSTLLQLICGTLSPSSGTINTNGKIAALLELGSGFNPEFSGRDNVYMNATILGLSQREIDACYQDILSFADIGAFIDQPVKTYSSGMIVRLAFAVSVMVNPDILVVDEALAVGDAGFQFRCLERINQLKASGVTVLFVSHSIDMIKTFCDRALFLKNGHLAAQGSPEDMSELYMMDMRSEQIQASKKTDELRIKTALGGGFAFGTNGGRIIAAGFMNQSGCSAIYHLGDPITLWVEIEFDHNLKKPAISMLLQDKRLIPITGMRIDLSNNSNNVRVEFSFAARLSAGSYFITLRLEEHSHSYNDTDFNLLEKQAGALMFEVMHAAPRTFFGLVDFDISGKIC